MMKKIFISAFVFALMVNISWASYITLNTTVNSKIEGNTLKVLITVINKGDEAAHNVQAEMNVAGKKIMAKKMQELGVNETYKVFEEIKLNLKQPGEYPLVVTMHYADANQYPFSALNLQTFAYRAEEVPAEVFGRMGSATFWKHGEIKLALKNLSYSDIATMTRLIVPRELTVDEGSQKINVAPKGQGEADFKLKNFSALSGSTYQVFAVSEYEKDGMHQTNITPGTIKIVERKNIFGLDYLYLAIALMVLILLFVVFQIFKK